MEIVFLTPMVAPVALTKNLSLDQVIWFSIVLLICPFFPMQKDFANWCWKVVIFLAICRFLCLFIL